MRVDVPTLKCDRCGSTTQDTFQTFMAYNQERWNHQLVAQDEHGVTCSCGAYLYNLAHGLTPGQALAMHIRESLKSHGVKDKEGSNGVTTASTESPPGAP